MYILGISGQCRNAAAALIRDGDIIAALEEEKLSGIKHVGIDQCGGIPSQSIQFCLRAAGISFADLDYVSYYSNPWRSIRRQLNFGVRQARSNPLASVYHSIAGIDELRQRLQTQDLVKRMLSERSRFISIDHQLAHASSSFYLSGFDRAVILVLGGVGDYVTIAVGVGEGSQIQIVDRIQFPHSLGWVYGLVTEYLGYRFHREEYKTQWLSVTGEPEFLGAFRDLIRLDKRGFPAIDPTYFSSFSGPDQFSERFYLKFGDPLRSNLQPLASQLHQASGIEIENRFMIEEKAQRKTEPAIDRYRRNIACSLQHRLNEVVLAMAENLRAKFNADALCLAGGVALNSLMVSKLVRESSYKHVFVQPAAGNTGSSLGAALYLWHNQLGRRPANSLHHVYLGPEYSDQEIKLVLDNSKLTYRYLNTEQKLIDEVIDLLTQGRIVAWFQGRAEFGPRSLGARSILATPLESRIRENLNLFVMHRENFRPFGVSVPEEEAHRFFETCDPLSKYLLTVTRVRDDKRQTIPAAWFAEGLARVHTVNQCTNPLFWRLLKGFGDRTGVPILINTSFNLFGNTMVCTPRDAVRSFYCSGIEAMAINRFLLSK